MRTWHLRIHNILSIWGATFALLVFGSIATAATDQPPFPSNYQDLVEAQIKQTFSDPYSLRDVMIAPPRWDGPVPGHTDVHPAWLVCLSANAKNQQGGYDGIRTHVFAIRDGRVFGHMEAWYSVYQVSEFVRHGLQEVTTSWESEGWPWENIFWGLEEMILTTFIHGYCRDANWRSWPELEGR